MTEPALITSAAPAPSLGKTPAIISDAIPAARAALDRQVVAQACVATPLGPMLIARTARGLAGAWFDGQRHHPGHLSAAQRPDDVLLRAAADQLGRYFLGAAADFGIPLDPVGTPFQQQVWSALRVIAAGHTRTYAEIARLIGAPRAVRAVGAAIGRNPLSVIVPCHRVLGQGGALTGYAGGLERKRALLDLEARAAQLAGYDVASQRLQDAS
jgi:methylated-DNA-[protein]-cysteine S-methyltransferase